MGGPGGVFSPEEVFDAGLTAQMRGDLDTAVARFEEVLAHHPHYVQAYLQLGKCEMRRGDLAAALVMLRRGLKKAPQSTPLLAELGFLQLVSGDDQRAEKVLTAASKMAKRNARALQGLGWLYVRRREWGRAAKVLDRLLGVSSRNFAGHFLMAQVHEAAGRVADAHQEWSVAEEICRQMIKTMDEPVAAEFYLGEIMQQTRTWEMAREHYEAAAEHAPADAGGYVFGLGLAVPWRVILERAALACDETGEAERAGAWRARLPESAEEGSAHG